MEEVFLRILGGDEAEAAVGDELLDGSGGHVDLQALPEQEWQNARPVRKGGNHAEHRRERRRFEETSTNVRSWRTPELARGEHSARTYSRGESLSDDRDAVDEHVVDPDRPLPGL